MTDVKQKEDQLRLHEILKNHDVGGMRSFIEDHPTQYSKVEPAQIADDSYLFDLIHIYKSLLPYFGEEAQRSMKYCLDKNS